MLIRDRFASEPELPFIDQGAFEEIGLVSKFGAAGLTVWRRDEPTCSEMERGQGQRLLVYVDAPNDPATLDRVRGLLRGDTGSGSPLSV